MIRYNPKNPKSYTDNFFSGHLDNSLTSAKNSIPVIFEYIKPNSVIDIGSGIGTWLSVWKELGVSFVHGVDGYYVDKSELLIDESRNKYRPVAFRGADGEVSVGGRERGANRGVRSARYQTDDGPLSAAGTAAAGRFRQPVL